MAMQIFAAEAIAHPERGFYNLLAQYPAFTFSASVATITGLLFLRHLSGLRRAGARQLHFEAEGY